MQPHLKSRESRKSDPTLAKGVWEQYAKVLKELIYIAAWNGLSQELKAVQIYFLFSLFFYSKPE